MFSLLVCTPTPSTCALRRSQTFQLLLLAEHPPTFTIPDELEVASAAERAAYEESHVTDAFAPITTGQSCTAVLRTKTDRFGRAGLLKGVEVMSILGDFYRLVFFMSPFNTVSALHRGPHRGAPPPVISLHVRRACVRACLPVCAQGGNHSFGGAAPCHDDESASRCNRRA